MHTSKYTELPQIGFIGLGTMGGGMVRNLLKNDYTVTVFDLRPEAVEAMVSAGAKAAAGPGEAVTGNDVVMTSLPSSSVFRQIAEEMLLPSAQKGQIFIDMGTTEAPATRKLAAAFAQKGAALVDAPVSGGGSGAAAGTLHIFIGGDEAVVRRCRPILLMLGNPEHVVYCGPSGSGQVVKGVNQLAMGLGAAAYLEAVGFGVRAGVDPEVIEQAVGGPNGWRAQVATIARHAQNDTAETVLVKFPELPYFIREAQQQGFSLPLTEKLFEVLNAAPRNRVDNMGRPTVSFWEQLLKRINQAEEAET